MKKLMWPAGMVLIILIIWSLVTHPWAWLYGIGVHPYPASSSTPWTYQFLSGFVPSLTVLSLVTFIAGAWHHVNCHAGGCLRIGKHKIDCTPWCSRHRDAARAATRQQVTLDAISVQLGRIIELMEAMKR
jgi:hypothetical protein